MFVVVVSQNERIRKSWREFCGSPGTVMLEYSNPEEAVRDLSELSPDWHEGVDLLFSDVPWPEMPDPAPSCFTLDQPA